MYLPPGCKIRNSLYDENSEYIPPEDILIPEKDMIAIKYATRECVYPGGVNSSYGDSFFTKAEINFWYLQNNGDVNKTIYDLLIAKSEDNTLSLPGLSTSDTSSYFKRLASRYKPNNSGILGGV